MCKGILSVCLFLASIVLEVSTLVVGVININSSCEMNHIPLSYWFIVVGLICLLDHCYILRKLINEEKDNLLNVCFSTICLLGYIVINNVMYWGSKNGDCNTAIKVILSLHLIMSFVFVSALAIIICLLIFVIIVHWFDDNRIQPETSIV